MFKRILKSQYFWLSMILVFGFIVRLYRIRNPIADWHSWRQADTASVSKTFVKEGINLLYPRYHDVSSIQTGINNPQGYRFVEFPIFNAVHAILASTFPQLSLEVWGRLVSIFSSLTSVYLLFLIGRRFIGKLGGILAAFFFAFLPYNIYFSRVILPDPMANTFALLAIWLFVKFIDSEKLCQLLLSGLSFALAILIKPFSVFFVVPIVYLALDKYGGSLLKNAKLLIRFLLFSVISLVPFLLWRGWISSYPVGVPFFTWAFNGDHIRFRPAFWRWLFGERLGRLILGIWGILPFSLGVFKSERKNLFIQFFLLGMFLYVATVATANVRHDYYQIFIIPAVSLALAKGADYLIKGKEFTGWLSRAVLAFSVLMMIGMGAYYIKDFYNINHPEIIEAGKAVDLIAAKDALVVAPYNGDTAFLYQTNRWGWPAIDNSIDNIIERGADYYVSVTPGDADTQAIAKRFVMVKQTSRYVIIDLHQPKRQ